MFPYSLQTFVFPVSYKVLHGDVWFRVREIIRQVCSENGVEIIKGVLASDHVHMFVSIPPKVSVADLMRKMKGRSSHKVQREFPQLKKRYWGRHFWGRGYFSATNGAITEETVLQVPGKAPKRNPPAQAGSGLRNMLRLTGRRHPVDPRSGVPASSELFVFQP